MRYFVRVLTVLLSLLLFLPVTPGTATDLPTSEQALPVSSGQADYFGELAPPVEDEFSRTVDSAFAEYTTTTVSGRSAFDIERAQMDEVAGEVLAVAELYNVMRAEQLGARRGSPQCRA